MSQRNVHRTASTAGTKSSRIAYRVALALTALFLLVNCEQPVYDIDSDQWPTTDPEFRCTVAVANPHALGGTPQTSITNIPRQSPGVVPEHVRSYYLGGDCLTGVVNGRQWGHANAAAMLADWRRFYPRRLQFLATNPAESSVLAAFPGGWCEIPGTATCTPTGNTVGRCRRSDPLAAEDLALGICPASVLAPPTPPGPEPNPPCLDIRCGTGAATCIMIPNDNNPPVRARINFGDVLLGTDPPPRHDLIVSKCGGDNTAQTTVSVDGMLTADSPQGDEHYVVPKPANPISPQDGENTCYPPNIDNSPDRIVAPGQPCTIPVVFAPRVDGTHTAHFMIGSNARQIMQVDLGGVAEVSDSLSVVVDPVPNPTDISDDNNLFVCLADTTVQPNCTDSRVIQLTNTDPTPMTVSSIRIEPANTRFELAETFEPAVIPIPNTIAIAPNTRYRFELRWCGGNQDETGTLIVNYRHPGTNLQTYEQDIKRDSADCLGPDEI